MSATIDEKVELTVDAILADPKFDIEQFIHNVTLHFEKPTVLEKLIADPAIRLAIAESDNYAILVHLPGEADDFFKMSTLGLETWCKKTGDINWGNVWYGVIVNDDLAISYRRVNHEPEVTVRKFKGAAKEARKRWRQLKLQELGKEKDRTSVTPGHRYIDKVRKSIYEDMKKKNFTRTRWYGRHSRYGEGTSADIELKSPSHQELKFRIQTSGSKNVKIHVHDPNNKKQSSYDHSGKYDEPWENTKISVINSNTSENLPADEVATMIFEWLKTTNTHYGKPSAKVSV